MNCLSWIIDSPWFVFLLYYSILQDFAATFMVNPPTAWVMLKNYVDLSKGDYVIQNSSNSGVGRSVIQLCKGILCFFNTKKNYSAWGIKTINIIRNRKNVGLLKTELWRIGADHVFTEEEFETYGKKVDLYYFDVS